MDVDILLDNSLGFRVGRLLTVIVTGVGQAWHVAEGEAQRVRGGGERTVTLICIFPPLCFPPFFFLISYPPFRFFSFFFTLTMGETAGRVVVVDVF